MTDYGWLEEGEQEQIEMTMGEQVNALAEGVVGQIITHVEKSTDRVTLTLDSGRRVHIVDINDCCGHGYVHSTDFDLTGAVVTHVQAESAYTKWYLLGEHKVIGALDVGWGVGNYPYYMYGLDIRVTDATEEDE